MRARNMSVIREVRRCLASCLERHSRSSLLAVLLTLGAAGVSAQTQYCAQRISTGLTGSQCFSTLTEAESFLRADTIPERGNKFLEPLASLALAANHAQIQYGVRNRRYASVFGDWFFAFNYGGGERNCGIRVPLSGIVNYGCETETDVINALLNGYPYTGSISGGVTGNYGPTVPSNWGSAGYDTATARSYVVVYYPQQKTLSISHANGTPFGSEPLNKNEYFACPKFYSAKTPDQGARWPLVCGLDSTGNINVYSSQFGSCCKDGNPVVAATGNKEYRESDFQWDGHEFRRAYNSLRDIPTLSGMGHNWAHNFSDRLVMQSNITTDMLWVRSDGYFDVMSLVSPGIYRSRNEVGAQMFRESDAIASVAGRWKIIANDGRIMWFDDAGRLKRLASGNRTYTLSYCGVAELGTGTCYSTDSLTSVVSSNGRRLDFDYTVIAVSADPQTSDTFDGVLINRIRAEGVGIAEYGYDNLGRMISSRTGDLTAAHNKQYLYAEAANVCRDGQGAAVSACSGQNYPHHLTGVLDENSVRVANYTYDEFARATSSEHAGGAGRVSLNYVTSASAVVTLPQGTTKTYQFDGSTFRKPMATQYAAPGGATLSTTNRVYTDSMLASVDADGARSCYEYDAGRKLEIARVEGLPTSQACAAIAPGIAALPPGSRKTSTLWHPEWRLETKRAEPKKLITYVYNGQPDPFNGNATTSCAPVNAVLPNGSPLPVLCKKVEQASTDGNGASGFTASAQGADPHFNNVVLLLHADGASGGTTFTDSSNAQRAPLSTVAPVSTDASNGRFGSASVNFTGGYLRYADSPDWDMGSAAFTIEMWAKFNSTSAGQRAFLLGKADSTASLYSFELGKFPDDKLAFYWNASGGTGGIQDPNPVVPNTWYHIAITRSGDTVTLWRNGAAVAAGAVSGSLAVHATQLGIGVLGEYDYSYSGFYGTRMMGWLDEIRFTKGVARYTAAFPVPTLSFPDSSATGSVVVPTPLDANVPNRIQRYTYNQHGQVLTATDPRNNTTTYAYYTDTAFTGADPNAVGHTIGDLQSSTNAAGHVTQYTLYDKSGRLLRSIDANGATTDNQYSPRGWLTQTSITPAGGGSALTTIYGYDNAGQLTSVTYPGQGPITYAYDPAHRLTGITDAAGNSVTYTLDNAGNRTKEEFKGPAGVLARSLSRAYDALNRVQSTAGGMQ